MSFAEAESAGKKRETRRQRFLDEMEKLVPWSRLLTAIEPYYPKGTRGRPPIGLERMLRIYFLQQWYSLSDEGLEDALYDSIAMRAFAGIDLAVENVPDATTLLKFRRLLLEHDLTRKLSVFVNVVVMSLHAHCFNSTGGIRSGLSQTSSFNSQLRVERDQRCGLRAFACA
ncbi:hypothetical protein BamMEX5DRAFT_6321 [Burkholderia ambifaria MEX-5]|uniref:Transposase InsH N-terminal domain-containing protein n=1 Tax=Burkholderia ambifaria MEX-5 TaxID=396597 RepID=B1TEV5_9BURK|nr:hypothetical protein BamMEX5DRAFT_6321 [Burkholderia ambifaria MEX-5]